MSAGVYMLRSRKTGQRYIGASIDTDARRKQHLLAIGRRRHFNAAIDRLAKTHRPEDFEFLVLGCKPRLHRTIRESAWIEKLKPECNGNRGLGPKPASQQKPTLSFRVSGEMLRALKEYQERYKLLDGSEAARQAVMRTLQGEGLLFTSGPGRTGGIDTDGCGGTKPAPNDLNAAFLKLLNERVPLKRHAPPQG